MKKLRMAFFGLIASAMLMTAGPALANSCSSKAQAMVSGNPNLTLLAVQSQSDANGRVTCVARIRVAGSNGQPPRVVVRRFNP